MTVSPITQHGRWSRQGLAAEILAQGVKASPSGEFATTPHLRANGLPVALGATNETQLRLGLEIVRNRLRS